MRVAQKFAGLLAGRSRQPPEGVRQEEPRAHGEGAREVRGRLRDHRLRRATSARRCSTSSSRSPTTRSTRATATATGSSPTRPPTSRRTTRSSTSPRLLTSVKTQPRQGRGLPHRVPPDGHRGAGARRQRVVSPTSSPCAGDARPTASGGCPASSRSGCRRCATWARAWSSCIVGEREANGPFVDFYDFCDRVDLSVLNKRTIESLIKAGGFDSMGHPRQGLLLVLRADHRPHPRPPPRGGRGPVRPVRRCWRSRRRRRRSTTPGRRSPTIEFDKKERLGFEKEMLGLYVSDHPLHGGRGVRCAAAPTCSIAELDERRGRRHARRSAGSSPACSASGRRRAT